MGYKRRRDFKSRVISVLRSEMEAKRVVQTKAGCTQIEGVKEYPSWNMGLYTEDAANNKWCWNFQHDRFQVFPLSPLAIYKGLNSGFANAGGTLTTVKTGVATAET